MKPYEIRQIIEKLTDDEIKEELKQNNIFISDNKIINLINIQNVYWNKYIKAV